jgi:DNA-directed RNA polymerase specialized sigma24 family protein
MPDSTSHYEFPQTDWTRLLAARGGGGPLNDAVRVYWSPVYAFLRRSGLASADAEDLTQDFMTTVVLGRDLIGRADPERARFRTFLRASLKNFLLDHHKSAPTRERRATKPLALGAEHGEVGAGFPEPAAGDTAEVAFDRQWAAALIDMALRRAEGYCEQNAMGTHWRLFRAVSVDPLGATATPPGQAATARLLGVEDAKVAVEMIQTARKIFRRMFRATVAETVADGTSIDDELARVLAALGVTP